MLDIYVGTVIVPTFQLVILVLPHVFEYFLSYIIYLMNLKYLATAKKS